MGRLNEANRLYRANRAHRLAQYRKEKAELEALPFDKERQDRIQVLRIKIRTIEAEVWQEKHRRNRNIYYKRDKQ